MKTIRILTTLPAQDPVQAGVESKAALDHLLTAIGVSEPAGSLHRDSTSGKEREIQQ